MYLGYSSFLIPFLTLLLSEDDGKNPPVPPVKPDKPAFDDAQQKHINDLLAAERKNAEERTEQRLKTEADKRDQDAKDQRERDEAAKRGEFDKVRTELEGKVTATETERDTLKTENDALTAYFTAQYATALKDLPEVITAFAPAEDASVTEKSEWLAKAQEQAAKVAGATKPGNGPNPKPGDPQHTIEQATEQMRGRVSI
jgi:hypothetical protein